MGFSDSIDAMLTGRKKSAVKRNGILMILVLVLLDGACVVFLRESLSFVGLPPPKWTLPALLSALPSFADDTVDVQLLFILRILTISTLAIVAVWVGTPDLSGIKKKGEEGVAPMTEPLLINGGGGGAAGPSHDVCPPCGSPQPGSGGAGGAAARAKQLQHEVNAEHLESHQRKQAAEQKKNVLITAIFIASTASQCYVGIKCVSFVGVWPAHPEAMSVQG